MTSSLWVQWIGALFAVVAVMSAAGALFARSFLATALLAAIAFAACSTAVMAFGGADASLALLLVGGVWTPVLLLCAMLLSADAAKRQRRRWPVATVLAGAAVATLLSAPLLESGASLTVRVAQPTPGLAFWLAPLALAIAAACIGLLGYGERGALRGRSADQS